MTAKEAIVGSGFVLTRTYHTVEAAQLEQLSGSSHQVCEAQMRRLGWAVRSHTGWAAHRGYASCRKQH